MSRILIAGASRGIGFEFARQLIEAGWDVHGTARHRAGLGELERLGATPHLLEISDDASIAALARELAGVPLDVVFANAGISGDLSLPMEAVSHAEMFHVMNTNTLSALMLMTALKPNIAASERKLALGMSSLMSSISSNDWGEQYAYRASKTALNAIWRSLAEEWKPEGIAAVLLRPGLVKTDMTNGRGMEVEVSVAGLRRVLGDLSLADAGRCVGFDGLDVPW